MRENRWIVGKFIRESLNRPIVLRMKLRIRESSRLPDGRSNWAIRLVDGSAVPELNIRE